MRIDTSAFPPSIFHFNNIITVLLFKLYLQQLDNTYVKLFFYAMLLVPVSKENRRCSLRLSEAAYQWVHYSSYRLPKKI